MKKTKVVYYVSTSIISLMMLYIAYETLTMPHVKESMIRLGFPDYFRVQLGITKILGTVLLWMPVRLLKETAYFGFAFTFLSAAIAHYMVGDPTKEVIVGMVFLVILIASYISNHKIINQTIISNTSI